MGYKILVIYYEYILKSELSHFDMASNCDGINNDIYQHWLQYFLSTLQL